MGLSLIREDYEKLDWVPNLSGELDSGFPVKPQKVAVGTVAAN